VTTAADRSEQAVRTGEADCTHDVRRAGAARDERWLAVEGGIPQAPCVVVTRVARGQQAAPQAGAQIRDVSRSQCDLPAIETEGADLRARGSGATQR
jgi:hypothetical protein